VSGTSDFVVGRPFTITFTLLSGVPDSQPGQIQTGDYHSAISAYQFNYDGGAYIGTAGNGRFAVFNNLEADTDAVVMDSAGTTDFSFRWREFQLEQQPVFFSDQHFWPAVQL
jgi:hypothetical protein